MLEKIDLLQQHFGTRLKQNVRLANHTTSRVGGPAAYLADAESAEVLAADALFLWEHDISMQVFGSGANMLISDAGTDSFILLNKAKHIELHPECEPQFIVAESGAALAAVAREAVQNGYDGLVWASTIPGTLGGAVYGNAGAHGGDMSHSLVMAEILHREKGRISLSAEQMEYSYRSSVLKRSPGTAVILSAKLALRRGNPDELKAAVQANMEKRRLTQPSGACFGSTFKNPVGGSAGRLIEEAGLKGFKIGGVQISPVHANFLVNDGTGTAEDYRRLIKLAQETVYEKSGIKLELEIEMIGKWQQ